MQTSIKSILSTFVILIALCTSSFAQDKVSQVNSSQTTQTQTTKVRAEYLPANIEKAQEILKAKGLYKGSITGTIDSTTKAAIKAYQQEVGLNPTGHLNKDTRQKLGIEISNNVENGGSRKKTKEINKTTDSK